MNALRTLLSGLVIGLSSVAVAEEAAPAPAPPPPAAEEIKRVLEYQDHGKDRGPALLDVIPCLKIDQAKGSPTQFHCVEPITAPVKKGTAVNVWLQFFCPKDGKYEDLSIQWLHEGQVRTTMDVTVAGLARTRTWRTSTLAKAGKWTVKVLRGDKELGSTTVVVTEN